MIFNVSPKKIKDMSIQKKIAYLHPNAQKSEYKTYKRNGLYKAHLGLFYILKA
jgi:hypothetical protein